MTQPYTHSHYRLAFPPSTPPFGPLILRMDLPCMSYLLPLGLVEPAACIQASALKVEGSDMEDHDHEK